MDAIGALDSSCKSLRVDSCITLSADLIGKPFLYFFLFFVVILRNKTNLASLQYVLRKARTRTKACASNMPSTVVDRTREGFIREAVGAGACDASALLELQPFLSHLLGGYLLADRAKNFSRKRFASPVLQNPRRTFIYMLLTSL